MKHVAEIRGLELPTISGMVRRQRKEVKILKRENEPEEDISPKTPPTVKQILESNTNMVTTVRNRLRVGRKRKYYYLTTPGLIRIAEVLFALVHIGIFGFYCSYFENVVPIVIPPFFLGNSREEYFLLTNYHSALGGTTIVFAGIFSGKSNIALLASLFPCLFDFIQFLSVIASSISLIVFYKQHSVLIKEVMPYGYETKQGTAFSGVVLALLHAIGAMYGILVFLRRFDAIEQQGILIDEEGNLNEDLIPNTGRKVTFQP